MFDFKKEVNKFRPMTEIDDLENLMLDNEVQDIMDLLLITNAEKAKKTDKKSKEKDKKE